MDQLDDLLVCVPLIMIAAGLGLVLVVCLIADPADRKAYADSSDPFFWAIGECPTVPPDAIGNYRRHLAARDFRPGVAE